MSDTPISALPTASLPLTGTEIIPMVQGGKTVQASSGAIAGTVTPGGAAFSTQYNNAGSFAGIGPGSVSQFLISNGPGVAPGYQTVSPNGSTTNHDGLISLVSTLLHMDGTNGSTTFTDSSVNALVFTAGGGAQLSTANPKFGTACGTFSPSGSNITSPIVAFGPLDILSGDFTIEGWFNPTDVSNQRVFFDISNLANGGLRVYVNGGSLQCQGFGFGSLSLAAAGSISANNWHHVALVRYGATAGLFVDGVPSWVIMPNVNPGPLASSFYIGGSANSIGQSTGYAGLIDEFRVTKGAARYISQFAVPTAAFPNQ